MFQDFKEFRQHVLENQGHWYMLSYPVPNYRILKDTELPENPELRWGLWTKTHLESVCFEYDPVEKLVGRARFPMTEDEEEYKKAYEWRDRNFPFGIGQTGHCEPYYDELFRLGMDGLKARIASLESNPARQSFLMALDGMTSMISHAAEAAEKAGNVSLAQDYRKMMHEPPEHFRQALILMQMTDIGIQIGNNSALVGPGRIDKRLGRYYEKDLAGGIITRQEALELIACLYIHINDLCHRGLAYPVMVGGDTVNEVSYLALEAQRLSWMVYPSLGICVNENTPEDLKALAVDIIAEGSPNPAFFNDRLIRKGLESYGVPASESHDYINSTCVEITPCGASGVWVASPYYNLSATLLKAMETEHPDFESLQKNFRDILSEKIAQEVKVIQEQRLFRQANTRRPLQSVFTRDCIGRGRDIEDGGALYNWAECAFVGLANYVDALYVIREEVFEQKNFTLAGLREILANNFEGHADLQQKFLRHYPKYGTGDERVDSFIPPLTDFIRKECAKWTFPPDNARYIPGLFCWEMHQKLGSVTGATADGRSAGFPFADGAGPAQGRETSGPTAAIRSVTSWDHSPMIGGSAFNMRFSKQLLASPEGRKQLLALIDVFIQRGGFETQINVADKETLLKAKEHPEEYADLVVRIGGYTDYFVRLAAGMQDELLLRMDYESL